MLFLLSCFLFPADRSCHAPVKGRAALLVPPFDEGYLCGLRTFMEHAA